MASPEFPPVTVFDAIKSYILEVRAEISPVPRGYLATCFLTRSAGHGDITEQF